MLAIMIWCNEDVLHGVIKCLTLREQGRFLIALCSDYRLDFLDELMRTRIVNLIVVHEAEQQRLEEEHQNEMETLRSENTRLRNLLSSLQM